MASGVCRRPVHGRIGSLTRPAHPGSDNPGGLIVQEFIDGVPIGVVFSGSTLLGATRQLIGTDWLGGTGSCIAVASAQSLPSTGPSEAERPGEKAGLPRLVRY
jgi:hypothetical protein